MSPLVLIFTLLLLYYTYKWMVYKPKNFPPGPPRLPLLGAYPYMLLLNYKHLHKAVDWLCKYYKTDVLGLYAAHFPTIVANTTETAKECLNNPYLDGKPQLMLAKLRDPELTIRGIFFTEGPVWHEQRRYLLRNLRDYGFGRRFEELEIEINDELLHFIDLLKHGPKYGYEKDFFVNGRACVPNIFFPLFGNIFHKVLLNERLPREKLSSLYEAAKHGIFFVRKADDWGRMFSYIEWWNKIFPNWSDYNILRDTSEKYYACIKKIIDEQYKTFDHTHERHFVDMYFKKIDEAKDNTESSFYYQQLLLAAADFFLPALVANAIQIQFLIQRFYLQPEVLWKCQNEIDKVVGQGRLPSLSDRVNLNYVEATIRESLRHETLVPSGLPHTATHDTTFSGYDIPKGTIAFSSLYASHLDTSVWKDPESFVPERFLDENGKFSVKLDKSLPFGAGKRLCAGETFARNSLFLVATALMQNFNIVKSECDRIPDPKETHTGFARVIPTFWVKLVPREHHEKNTF